MTETQHTPGTAVEHSTTGVLAVTADQREFTRAQRAALAHMGVENATAEDLAVYLHQIQRTGLDPFTRQIHMIGRRSKRWDPQTRTESWETKWTIQTGIDGYRLIGRRAADARGETISVLPPEWMHPDGGWRPAWTKAWGMPLAARVTIVRGGQPFTATALMDEYVQVNGKGTPTKMWADRPAGMLAKCAEALAWRMGFPQDLSGLYTHEEMAQADNEGSATVQAPRLQAAEAPHAARQRFTEAATRAAEHASTVTGEIVEEDAETITMAEWQELRPHLTAMGYATGEAQGAFAAEYLQRPVTAPTQITREEFERLAREVAPAEAAASAPDPADPSRPPHDVAQPGA